MSVSYRKYARQIPDWKKYRKQALFQGLGGVQCYIHFYDESLDRNSDAYPFLANLERLRVRHESFSWYFFKSDTLWTGTSHDTHYYSESSLQLPKVHSKKKRTQNHAILVALSNASRRYTRHNNGGPRAKGTVIDIELPDLN